MQCNRAYPPSPTRPGKDCTLCPVSKLEKGSRRNLGRTSGDGDLLKPTHHHLCLPQPSHRWTKAERSDSQPCRGRYTPDSNTRPCLPQLMRCCDGKLQCLARLSRTSRSEDSARRMEYSTKLPESFDACFDAGPRGDMVGSRIDGRAGADSEEGEPLGRGGRREALSGATCQTKKVVAGAG